jgi:hypothetical protein
MGFAYDASNCSLGNENVSQREDEQRDPDWTGRHEPRRNALDQYSSTYQVDK